MPTGPISVHIAHGENGVGPQKKNQHTQPPPLTKNKWKCGAERVGLCRHAKVGLFKHRSPNRSALKPNHKCSHVIQTMCYALVVLPVPVPFPVSVPNGIYSPATPACLCVFHSVGLTSFSYFFMLNLTIFSEPTACVQSFPFPLFFFFLLFIFSPCEGPSWPKPKTMLLPVLSARNTVHIHSVAFFHFAFRFDGWTKCDFGFFLNECNRYHARVGGNEWRLILYWLNWIRKYIPLRSFHSTFSIHWQLCKRDISLLPLRAFCMPLFFLFSYHPHPCWLLFTHRCFGISLKLCETNPNRGASPREICTNFYTFYTFYVVFIVTGAQK